MWHRTLCVAQHLCTNTIQSHVCVGARRTRARYCANWRAKLLQGSALAYRPIWSCTTRAGPWYKTWHCSTRAEALVPYLVQCHGRWWSSFRNSAVRPCVGTVPWHTWYNTRPDGGPGRAVLPCTTSARSAIQHNVSWFTLQDNTVLYRMFACRAGASGPAGQTRPWLWGPASTSRRGRRRTGMKMRRRRAHAKNSHGDKAGTPMQQNPAEPRNNTQERATSGAPVPQVPNNMRRVDAHAKNR
jgi:hypothetical protein